jgi:putative PIN family toxin of toxin-antitoxin system
MILRVVFDTNILYSAIRQPKGLPAKAVDLVTSGLVLPCVSNALRDEYRDVLLRPELDLHAGRRRLVLDLFSSLALHVTPTETLKISDDEDDNRG